MFSCVKTRITPGARLASVVSIELDRAFADAARHDKTVSEIGDLEFRGVFRLARHFRDAVDAAHFFSDVSCHVFSLAVYAAPPVIARCKARTIARFPSSTL